MKTLNELLDLAAQGKLDEIDTLAALAQKWSVIGDGVTISPFGLIDRPYWQNEDGSEGEYVDDYHPTRDKAQAWDLAKLAGLQIDFSKKYVYEHSILRDFIFFEQCKSDPLIAVTIVFILAMQ